ncbi:unnamed protein product [Tenebrio molitor]|jgi:hypothetical protein|nr:unnamed protein product [Tenebrio molitor]
MDKLVSYIPNDEKEKWKKDLKPIITEIDRLEDGAKIVGFKQEVVDKYIARKTANLFLEQLIMTDCELESANNKIDELEYKLDNYNNYDPKKLAELRNKTVVIPSNIDDVKKRTLKIFERHTKNMRAINQKIQKL